ncbi:hypothetical protein V8E51_009372 [Hyaloscypha variabilis]|jgi:hypothetical protein
MSRYPEEEQAQKPYKPYLRESVITTFSLPETLMSESLETRSLENIVMSTERPIIVRNPNYQAPKQDSPWKPWMPKLLIGLFVVLGLALVLAVVLVVLAALGYLGKEKVDVIDVVQPTATATATATDTPTVTDTPTATTAMARALGTLAASSRVCKVVVASSGGKTMKSVGILVMEVMLGWTLVYLFEKFEHREKKPESCGKERRRRSRSTGSGSVSGSSRSRSRSRGRSRARNK